MTIFREHNFDSHIDWFVICHIALCWNRLVSNCAATKEQSRGSGE